MARREKKTKLISFHIPKEDLEKIDELVKKKIFQTRSEAIRYAIKKLLDEYAREFTRTQ